MKGVDIYCDIIDIFRTQLEQISIETDNRTNIQDVNR